MRFVLGNRHLIAAGGTEVHLVTIGEQLQRLGHEVVLYAPELGPFADHCGRRGLEVRGAARELPETCNVTFAQDGIVVYDLAERYPSALSVFRVCGDVADFQLPPQLAGIVDLIVVLSDRYERLARACAVSAPVLRMSVPIDIDRLVPSAPIRETPRRAVLLGNYLDRDEVVRAAWAGPGLEVIRVGGYIQEYDVAAAIADADIVVAKARAALDAMACGRAVYIYDTFGGDGWVTTTSYAALEADNFAGQATGRVLDAQSLAVDLSAYDRSMGSVNRDLVLQHHDPRRHVVELVEAIAAHRPQPRPTAPYRELARLTALAASWEVTAREFRSRYWPLREHAARVEREALDASHAHQLAAKDAAHAYEKAVAYARELEARLGNAAPADTKAANAPREANPSWLRRLRQAGKS